jgi:hypothetical protein
VELNVAPEPNVFFAMSKYPLVKAAAEYCWGKNGQQLFEDFRARHAHVFVDAPSVQTSGEQNLEYHDLFQRYLRVYEENLSEFIESRDATDQEFYEELCAIQNDPDIKDKKLLNFVKYLVACTDYPEFYKLMVRAAKKLNAQDSADSKGSDSGFQSKGDSKGGKAEGKGSEGKGSK